MNGIEFRQNATIVGRLMQCVTMVLVTIMVFWLSDIRVTQHRTCDEVKALRSYVQLEIAQRLTKLETMVKSRRYLEYSKVEVPIYKTITSTSNSDR